MSKSKYAIIVAGGKGERMKKAVPKQFLVLKGKPVLMHTLSLFHHFDGAMKLIVVLPELQLHYWAELCREYAFDVPHRVVAGGLTRFESVQNGLKAVEGSGLVAVHDGVRPLVSEAAIGRCFAQALLSKAAIPVIEMVDSIRQIQSAGSVHADRTAFRLVQTPQIFDADLLRRAYEQEYSLSFTDDASVVEALGHSVELVEGNRENIKITTEFDLKVAEALLS